MEKPFIEFLSRKIIESSESEIRKIRECKSKKRNWYSHLQCHYGRKTGGKEYEFFTHNISFFIAKTNHTWSRPSEKIENFKYKSD